jgi:hypothetical protein
MDPQAKCSYSVHHNRVPASSFRSATSPVEGRVGPDRIAKRCQNVALGEPTNLSPSRLVRGQGPTVTFFPDAKDPWQFAGMMQQGPPVEWLEMTIGVEAGRRLLLRRDGAKSGQVWLPPPHLDMSTMPANPGFLRQLCQELWTRKPSRDSKDPRHCLPPRVDQPQLSRSANR